MKKIFTSLAVLILLFTGCKKDQIEKTGTVEWFGDYATDGCGFFVYIDGETYKPDDESKIGDEFKILPSQQIQADLVYKLPGNKIEFSCGFAGLKTEKAIDIISIKKK